MFDLSQRWQRSVRFRLVIIIVLTVTLVVALLSGANYLRKSAEIKREQAESAAHLSDFMARTIAQPLYDFNMAAVGAALEAVASRPDIDHVMVSDLQGKVLLGSGAPQAGSAERHCRERVVHYASKGQSLPVGTLLICFSSRAQQDELQKAAIDTVQDGAFIALVAAAVLLWGVRILLRPLGPIAEALNQLTAGETEIVLPAERRQDEFGQLQDALRHFRDLLLQHQGTTQRLLASQARFRDFSSSSADWFWEMDEHLRFSFFSENFEAVYGHPPASLLGHTRRELMARNPANRGPEVEAHLAQLDRHQPFRDFRYCLSLPGGGERWYSISGVPHFSPTGEFRGYRGLGVDITIRRQQGELVRKLSMAVEQTPNSIMITDAAHNLEYVNESFCKTTGYSREEVIGRNPRFLQSGDTPAATFKEMQNALSRGQTWHGELFNRGKHGQLTVESMMIAPIRDSDGHITHFLSISEDVTERRRKDEELERYRQNLEVMVEERTRELALAMQAAEAANNAKSTFLANMSHELRTPLHGILGLADLLGRRTADEHARSYIDNLKATARHMEDVVNDVLDVARIEAGRLAVEQTLFATGTLQEKLDAICAPNAQRKNLAFSSHFELPEALIGDPVRILQMLLNMAGNAIKFTERGSVAVRGYVRQRGADRQTVRFEVIDTGIGIPADKQHLIFEAFEQADSGVARKYGGTGLGLAITRKLAQLMGGEAGVSSQPGVGSTFWFDIVLPAEASLPGSDEVPARAGSTAGLAGKRVLIVDDEPINQMILAEFLTELSIEAVQAENGFEALRQAEGGAFDLILMDMQMPVMDGLRATEAIRRLPAHAATPIIALTANVLPEHQQKARAAGMNDFLAKPFDTADLIEKLAHWLPAGEPAEVA